MPPLFSFGRIAGLALTLLTASATPALAQTTTLFNFNVAGIFSNDGFGSPINERRSINVGQNALITGIGFNVTLFADSPSWLSEMVVAFIDDDDVDQVLLRPGVGINAAGTQAFSSNGIVDLVGLGLSFNVGASGVLTLEFFEGFDDFPNDWDGIWQSGLLTIQATTPGTVVPEPATVGLLAFGLIAIGVVRRRQKA